MSRLSGFLVLVLIVLGNLGFWWLMNRPHSDMPFRGMIESISFSPFRKDDNPLENRYPTAASVDEDLSLVATKAKGIRLYSALPDDMDIAAMAARHGLTVTAGAWIRGALNDPNLHLDKTPSQMNGDELKAYQLQMHDLMQNEAELDAAVAMARKNDNVDRVIIGNETIYRGEATVQQMIGYIKSVKRRVNQPVSTAEPAYVWFEHPELAREVDFIALHVLPYWEGVPVDDAVNYVLGQIAGIKKVFPGKPVMLAEVGWPSAGKARQTAEPSLINQALFLRRFLNSAEDRGLDYNVIEAFDQPWKKAIEWSVGAHWGLWDADRNPKFSWTHPVIEVRQWPMQATAASLLALIPLVWMMFSWKHLQTRGKMFFAGLIQFASSLAIWSLSTPVLRDFAPSTQLLYTVLGPALLILLVVVLISGYELTELTWTQKMRRGFTRANAPKGTRHPKVSIHLPCYSEPPEMMKLTLDSLAAMDYPNFEVIVVDNNTKNAELWKPVLAHCEKLGPNFKFYHLGKWPGAKAGALNFALTVTDPEAEVIGVIDSDYIVEKDWLSTLVPHFENPKVGWVQAPQDHREWEDDVFKEFINWEYAGFFDIGMVARNEDNAIIQHGTMTLLRREAIETVGGWGEWCIVEDAELGLRLLQGGYDAVYLSERFGRGLTPDDFTAYKKQRFRWAYGAVQILKAHWRALVPFRHTGLTGAQKYHFVTGWLPWFADAFYLLFTLLSVVWTAGMVLAPQTFDFPMSIFVLPTVGVFVAKLCHHLFLYSTRVRCNWLQRLGAAMVGMALTYTIGRAMWWGLFTKTVPFQRTPKMAGKSSWTAGFAMARDETVLMVSQIASALAILVDKGWMNPEAQTWALVLGVQAVPFGAALITGLVSAAPAGGRLHRLRARLSRRRPARADAATPPADIRTTQAPS
jgi:exo-beta-1,3-glucanase (GH17 family)/cellulose synthase/poly-beta-1,6-N-acetylglucosamine synthase-like glycosyltransferase